jgi:hypothetical protein
LEDEEFFEAENTFRSQYRFENTEDDMLNYSDRYGDHNYDPLRED